MFDNVINFFKQKYSHLLNDFYVKYDNWSKEHSWVCDVKENLIMSSISSNNIIFFSSNSVAYDLYIAIIWPTWFILYCVNPIIYSMNIK